MRFIDMTYISNIINVLDNNTIISVLIIVGIMLGMFVISYLISKKIYGNKEF